MTHRNALDRFANGRDRIVDGCNLVPVEIVVLTRRFGSPTVGVEFIGPDGEFLGYVAGDPATADNEGLIRETAE